MAGELNLYGMFVPTILVQALLAYLILYLLTPLLDRESIKQWIMMPGLFHLCLYIIILGILVMVSNTLFS